MQEKTLQKNILKFCKQQSIIAHKTDSSSSRGWPDLTVVMPSGRVIFVELKTPVGRLSKLQEHTHTQLRLNNAEVYVVRSLGEFESLIQ